jgi:predicted RND superfamily exporter protein
MHEHLRHKLLGGWANLMSGHPWIVLGITLTLAAASIALTVARLEFNPNRNDLISDELDWNQRFIDWQDNFPGSFDLYVAVDAWGDGDRETPESRRTAERIVDELGARLKTDPHVRDVVWGFDTRTVSPRAMRLMPLDMFERQVADMTAVAKLLESETIWVQLGAAMRPAVEDEELGVTALRNLIVQGQQQWHYLTTTNGRLMIIRVTPELATDTLNAVEPAIRAIRAALAEVLAANPGGAAGLTGIEVVEADETDAATRDSAIASVVAVVLIAVLLIAAFHSVRTPLLIVASLLVGVAWAFGFLTLAIGYLQVISVVFTVMLLGLGVAFGIHIASRFELVRHNYPAGLAGFRDAMRDTIETMGPGVITGAITTSAAFCTTLMTDFTGVAEMGLIAGVGVLLCLTAMFTVFPALLRLIKPGHEHVRQMDQRRFHLYEDHWIAPFHTRPWVTIGVWVAAAGASLLAVTQMRFDYNLTNLLPRGIDSVEWQERIWRDGEQSIFYGISIVSSHEAARQRVEALRAAREAGSTIGDVGGYALLFPDDEPAKLALLADAREQVGAIVDRVAAEPPAEPRGAMALLGQIGQRIAGVRQELAANIAAVLDTSPLLETDLPDEVMRSYVAVDQHGRQRYAIEIYPRLDEGVTNPLDPRFLPRFIHDMQRVDPNVTGVIAQIFFSGDLIRRSYLIAGIMALAAVFVLVVLDFQKVTDGLMALLPVAMGFAVTFGLLWLLGQQVNPANIIVMPLMFGIGVDFGVHMLHRYRSDDVTRPLGLTAGTGKAIMLTSCTTIIGFGVMMIARHRGIASLGFVLALGIAMTLVACLTLMPALLELRSRRRETRRVASQS